jgi:hypothetical protein
VYSTRVKGAWNLGLIYKKHGYLKSYALAFPFPLLHSQEACVLSKNDLDTWYGLLDFSDNAWSIRLCNAALSAATSFLIIYEDILLGLIRLSATRRTFGPRHALIRA